MKLCTKLFVGLGLLAASSALVASPPPPPPPTPLTWTQLNTYEMNGANCNWFEARQLAADYVGPGTNNVTYSDWRLPTRAEYQAGITAGITGLWQASTWRWTSERRGSQQSWCARFAVGTDGVPPQNQTVQYDHFNSTYSFISAKFVRP